MSFDNIVLKQRRPHVQVCKRSAFDSSESSPQDSFDNTLGGILEDTDTTAPTKSISCESVKHDLKQVNEFSSLVFEARHKVKTKLRKEAKLQQKFLRKSTLIIPHLSQTIATTVATIEGALKLQTLRSNQLYSEFVNDQTNEDEEVRLRLLKMLLKMVKNLGIPQQCLTIACIYLNRAVRQMQAKEFYLSSIMVER